MLEKAVEDKWLITTIGSIPVASKSHSCVTHKITV